MALNFIEKGDSLDIVLGAIAASGAVVVLGDLVGVYKAGGASGDNVAVAYTGVYAVAKGTAASSGKAVGTKVYWDPAAGTSGQTTVTAGSLKVMGYVWKTSLDADVTEWVRLLG